MERPAVFVSSTFYDLKQVRSDIKQFLENLGLDPVLSEYNSFPINPDIGTLDNCLKVVEAKADIFVLAVGARYGSTTGHGRSITNLEYLTAKAKGIPIYVFVARSVLDVLPVWKSNRSADFSNVTDSAMLFDFVASLKETGESWVFPFDTAQEIFETLRTQLAYLFQDALNLRHRARLSGGLSPRLRALSGPALRLVIERPPAWEYLLFAEVLQDELKALGDVKRDWLYNFAIGLGSCLKPSRLLEWFQDKTSEASRITDSIASITNQALAVALGPPGVSGDPEAIVYAATRLAAAYRNALEWKLDFERIAVPNELERLRSLAGGLCNNLVKEIEEFSQTTKKSITEALASVRKGLGAEVCITLKLTCPDLAELHREMARLTNLVRSGALLWE
jgi:Domain of unknown function (DUF4062)